MAFFVLALSDSERNEEESKGRFSEARRNAGFLVGGHKQESCMGSFDLERDKNAPMLLDAYHAKTQTELAALEDGATELEKRR